MNCCICQKKSQELVYPLMPSRQFAAFFGQTSINAKIAFKSTCDKEYVHMKCAIFINGLKWVKDQVSNYHIDYVCFGLEIIKELKKKNQECCICYQAFETAHFRHWRKTIFVILDCEHPTCDKTFHVECLINRKHRVFWEAQSGKMRAYCQMHCRICTECRLSSESPSLVVIDWEHIEQMITAAVHANLATNDMALQQQLVEEEPELPVEIEPPELPPPVPQYRTEPQLNIEYSKPRPLYQINYESKGRTHQLPRVEERHIEPADYLQAYYQKPRIDERMYERKASPSPSPKKETPSQGCMLPEDNEPEPPRPPPTPRDPSLFEQDRFTHVYDAMQRPEERVQQVPKPRVEVKVERTTEMELRSKAPNYPIGLVNQVPVYPDDDDENIREEAMRAYWKAIDSHFFPQVVAEEVIDILQDRVNARDLVEMQLDEPVPSVHQFEKQYINVVLQGGRQGVHMFGQYRVKMKAIPEEPQPIASTYGGVQVHNGWNEVLGCEGIVPDITFDLELLNIQNITQREFQSCVSYQSYLKHRKHSEITELDIEQSFLMGEFGDVQDELIGMKRALVVAARQPQPAPSSEAERLGDELRYLQVVKCLQAGFVEKDARVMETFVLRMSTGFKKIMHLYPQQQNSKFLHIDCKVCFYHCNSSANPVVYCEKCDASYHKWCYGIAAGLEDKTHLCDVCTFLKDRQLSVQAISCFLCKQHYPGIPLKSLRGNFFHVQCLLISNFVIIERRQLLIPRTIQWNKIEVTVDRSKTMRCYVCEDMKGKKEKCEECTNHCHLLCAYLYGLALEIQVKNETRKPGNIELKLKCHLHHRVDNQTFYRRYPINYKDAASYKDATQFYAKYDDQVMTRLK